MGGIRSHRIAETHIRFKIPNYLELILLQGCTDPCLETKWPMLHLPLETYYVQDRQEEKEGRPSRNACFLAGLGTGRLCIGTGGKFSLRAMVAEFGNPRKKRRKQMTEADEEQSIQDQLFKEITKRAKFSTKSRTTVGKFAKKEILFGMEELCAYFFQATPGCCGHHELS